MSEYLIKLKKHIETLEHVCSIFDENSNNGIKIFENNKYKFLKSNEYKVYFEKHKQEYIESRNKIWNEPYENIEINWLNQYKNVLNKYILRCLDDNLYFEKIEFRKSIEGKIIKKRN